MSGIAEQANLVIVKPRRAPNGHQGSGRIFAEIFKQCWHKREGVGEFFVEEAADIVISLGGGEAARAFELPEECAGERTVRVRQRNHHKTFPWPDVERVLFHSP